MNVSMYTAYARRQGFDTPVDAFRHFYEQGVRFGDMCDDEFESLPMHLYCQYLTEAGLGLSSVVSMLDIASFDPQTRARNIAAVKGLIDQMHVLGVPRLMPAPSVRQAYSEDEFTQMRELLIAGFSELVDYARGSGVEVMLENQSTHIRADSRIDDLRMILDAVPGLGFVLDTGNFWCIGEDVMEAYRVLGARMTHIHCKDWAYDPYGGFVRENMPRFNGVAIGDGVLPLGELFAALRRDNCSCNVVLEVNAPRISLEMLDKSAAFLCRECSGV